MYHIVEEKVKFNKVKTKRAFFFFVELTLLKIPINYIKNKNPRFKISYHNVKRWDTSFELTRVELIFR